MTLDQPCLRDKRFDIFVSTKGRSRILHFRQIIPRPLSASGLYEWFLYLQKTENNSFDGFLSSCSDLCL